MSANNRFIVSLAEHSVSFWDTSTHTPLGSVLEDVDMIRSIALSPDGARLATGGSNKTIIIWNLSDILPQSYLPIAVSTAVGATDVIRLSIYASINPRPP